MTQNTNNGQRMARRRHNGKAIQMHHTMLMTWNLRSSSSTISRRPSASTPSASTQLGSPMAAALLAAFWHAIPSPQHASQHSRPCRELSISTKRLSSYRNASPAACLCPSWSSMARKTAQLATLVVSTPERTQIQPTSSRGLMIGQRGINLRSTTTRRAHCAMDQRATSLLLNLPGVMKWLCITDTRISTTTGLATLPTRIRTTN
jgi:hypothetical protein